MDLGFGLGVDAHELDFEGRLSRDSRDMPFEQRAPVALKHEWYGTACALAVELLVELHLVWRRELLTAAVALVLGMAAVALTKRRLIAGCIGTHRALMLVNLGFIAFFGWTFVVLIPRLRLDPRLFAENEGFKFLFAALVVCVSVESLAKLFSFAKASRAVTGAP